MLFAAGLSLQACGKQTEAMRCEIDDDCDTNLTCQARGFADKICCPRDLSRSTTSECKNGPPNPVTDTGTGETAPVTDSGTAETATDAPVGEAGDAGDTGTPMTTDAADAADDMGGG